MLPGRSWRTTRSLSGVRSWLMRWALLARSARVGTDRGLKSYSLKSRLWGEKLEVRVSRAHILSPPSGWEDFHLRAVGHARHTQKGGWRCSAPPPPMLELLRVGLPWERAPVL